MFWTAYKNSGGNSTVGGFCTLTGACVWHAYQERNQRWKTQNLSLGRNLVNIFWGICLSTLMWNPSLLNPDTGQLEIRSLTKWGSPEWDFYRMGNQILLQLLTTSPILFLFHIIMHCRILGKVYFISLMKL